MALDIINDGDQPLASVFNGNYAKTQLPYFIANNTNSTMTYNTLSGHTVTSFTIVSSDIASSVYESTTAGSSNSIVSPAVNRYVVMPTATYTDAFVDYTYEKYTSYDECSDSSIDTNKWSSYANGVSVTFSENTNYVQMASTGAWSNYDGIDNKSCRLRSKLDLKVQGMITLIGVRSSFTGSGNGTTGSGNGVGWEITDGDAGTTRGIITGGQGTTAEVYRCISDVTNNRLLITPLTSGVAATQIIDCTGLANWYFSGYFKSNASSSGWTGSPYVRVYFLRQKTGTETSTVTLSASHDNGTTYSVCDDNGLCSMNTTTQITAPQFVTKLSANITSGECVVVYSQRSMCWNTKGSA